MRNGKAETYGEIAVGLSFNPSGDKDVALVKEMIAEFIDYCHEIRVKSPNAEVKRMMSVAITESQTAQMWAVKALTWEK